MSNAAFAPTSRYFGLPTLELVAADGTTIVYVARRFIPALDRFALLQEYAVVASDRPDLIAARFLGDSEQFWRVCDANGVLRPDDLTATPGRVIRITLPEGIPGARRV
jgi:hypothetical protein